MENVPDVRDNIRNNRLLVWRVLLARLRAFVSIPNVIAGMMIWVGLAVLTAPDLYSIAELERATSGIITGELYGGIWIAMGAYALGANKSREMLILMQIPIWIHTLWVAWYSLLTLGNPLALPVPFYGAIATIMAVVASEQDNAI